jgi:hypothetical protein
MARREIELVVEGSQAYGLIHNHDWEGLAPWMDGELLDAEGRLKVVPSLVYEGFKQSEIALWAVQRGAYYLPTVEAVAFIRDNLLGSRDRALEIGAGSGAFGRALGVRMTDSYQQERPEIAAMYRLLQQPVIRYGRDVEKLDAHAAIEKYRPEVVVAAWVTNRKDEASGVTIGNPDGVWEEHVIGAASVRRYIFVGHEQVHQHKPVLRFPHETLIVPGLYSRSMQSGRNVVWVWDKS